MPARKLRQPSYRLHKPSGQAIVTIDGRTHYLGPYDSRESRNAYRRVLIQKLGHEVDDASFARRLARDPDTITIKALCAAYWEYAERTYVDPETGMKKPELAHVKTALRPLKRLFGAERVQDFGPLKLKDCRAAFVEQGLTRQTVNDHVLRLRRVVRWGVENELVRVDVLDALKTVSGLRRARRPPPSGGRCKPFPNTTWWRCCRICLHSSGPSSNSSV